MLPRAPRSLAWESLPIGEGLLGPLEGDHRAFKGARGTGRRRPARRSRRD
jgi:hypothetical protein